MNDGRFFPFLPVHVTYSFGPRRIEMDEAQLTELLEAHPETYASGSHPEDMKAVWEVG